MERSLKSKKDWGTVPCWRKLKRHKQLNAMTKTTCDSELDLFAMKGATVKTTKT